jgi:ABC-type uncharacterized transport system permease subunit
MRDITAAEAVRGFAVMGGWILGLSLLAGWIWRRGSRQYAGVGI